MTMRKFEWNVNSTGSKISYRNLNYSISITKEASNLWFWSIFKDSKELFNGINTDNISSTIDDASKAYLEIKYNITS